MTALGVVPYQEQIVVWIFVDIIPAQTEALVRLGRCRPVDEQPDHFIVVGDPALLSEQFARDQQRRRVGAAPDPFEAGVCVEPIEIGGQGYSKRRM